MEPMIEVMECHPRRLFSHNGDCLDPETATERWAGCGAAMWRLRPGEHYQAELAELLPWYRMRRILGTPGYLVDLDDLPDGHYVDARIMAVARERSVRLDAIWVTGCVPGPGVMVRGYNEAGEIVFVGMGKRDDP